MKYIFAVEVECETEEQAKEVMTERIGYDEGVGDNFDYTIDWAGKPVIARSSVEDRIMQALQGEDSFDDVMEVIDDLLTSS